MTELITCDPSTLTEAAVLAGRDQALAQVRWMRQYGMQLIESVPHELWYTIAPGMSTHLAWQVGHMSVAQYGLMLFRQRGRTESDMELMPGWLRKNFGRGSQPSTDPTDSKNPTPASLLERFTAIHAESCATAEQLTYATLMEPIDMPYAAYPNKLGALLFCPLHESVHIGQIGVLRRGLGLDPLR